MKASVYDEVLKSLEQAIEKVKQAQKEENYYFDFDSEYYMINDPDRLPMRVVVLDSQVVKLESEKSVNVIAGDLEAVRDLVSKL